VAGSCEHGNEPSGSIKEVDLSVIKLIYLTGQPEGGPGNDKVSYFY